jgi:hypothetical protein
MCTIAYFAKSNAKTGYAVRQISKSGRIQSLFYYYDWEIDKKEISDIPDSLFDGSKTEIYTANGFHLFRNLDDAKEFVLKISLDDELHSVRKRTYKIYECKIDEVRFAHSSFTFRKQGKYEYIQYDTFLAGEVTMIKEIS